MRDRNLVSLGVSRVAPICLLDLGVSEGAYDGSSRRLLGSSCFDGPGVGVSKTC